MLRGLFMRLRGLRAAGSGLVAQAFTFLALFLPVIFQRTEVVTYLVQVNAIAAFLLQIALLAIELRLPVQENADAARITRRAAVHTLVLVCVIVALSGLVLGWRFPQTDLQSVGLGAAVLLAGQGLYVVGIADLTNRLDYAQMMRTRFWYGVSTMVLTLVCSVLDAPGLLFAAAASFAYLLAVTVTRAIPRDTWGALRWRAWLAEIAASRQLVMSYAIGGFAASAGSLAVALAGPLQPAWAIVCRVMGGMQTVGGQVLGPMVDVGVAASVQRDGDPRRAIVLSHRLGGLLATGFLIGSCAALWWTGAVELSPIQILCLTVGAVGFGGAYVFQSPATRTLGMIGTHRARLSWDVARSVSALALFVLLDGQWLILALGIQGLLSVVAYCILVWRVRPGSRKAIDVVRV